ncbi:hypothetical protein PsorP6_009298 [Peronosclerospora sorghi]|uniref:Uncharacterized protein n=1 Tax=Peronosclerospora sorghi TaxID=230839 RepID=A0ACC0VZS0_9STRA|nr:hypothetical protein PsorP6_009298 [Peronosclerospora sorghi]
MPHDVMLGWWEFCAPFRVGRSRRCELSILTSDETRTVSKHHVNFIPYSTPVPHGTRRWIVYDLETANGTAVNGEEMATGGNRELCDGDEVILASAMRQCVRLLIQFKDESHSHIVVKVLTRSVAVSLVQMHHSMNTPEALTDRSTRRAVETETAVAATPGTGRSAMTSPSGILPGCLVMTPRREANLMTPPPQILSQKRSRASPRAIPDKAEKRTQETPKSQQRKRSRRVGESEVVVAATETHASTTSAKSIQERDQVERERLMMCSVCLEYFHGSATLPCSHTFCGYCISKWFRTSLSCPECRTIVKAVPVRNRALDKLVERLVGHTEAYKSHVRRRAWMQRRSMQFCRTQQGAREEHETRLEGAPARDVSSPTLVECGLRSNVFTLWSFETKLAFSAYISEQFGETRVAAFKRVGLTETAVDCLSLTELIIATQNLLLDSGIIQMISDECRQRLKIFLLFG